MDERITALITQGKELFEKRSSLLGLWQTIADNFYPERAEFTTTRALGAEFGADLMASHPVRARRELGDSLSAILRPTSKDWFYARTGGDWDSVGLAERAWLEKAQKIQKRAIYNYRSQFVQATKEADHDFVTFGQAVIQKSKNKDGDGPLYRCWHLRDVAWCDDTDGMVAKVYRKWSATIRDVAGTFGNRAHPRILERLARSPLDQVDIWHCVIPAGEHQTPGKTPFVSLYLDPTNNHVMEEVGTYHLGYVIPRWRRLSGTQYAYSPATLTALYDSRTLQAMVGVLLEAGEKAVNPPTVANKNVFGGAFSLYPGGTTWADMSDGRIRDHYDLLPMDSSRIPLGLEMAGDIRNQIDDSLYLSKLRLPPPVDGMTAYEVAKRTEEDIRQTLPLFEPMESEYNAPLMDVTFADLMRSGSFGPSEDIPPKLIGVSVQFVFESPLRDAVEAAKRQLLTEVLGVVAESQQIDSRSRYLVNVDVGARDVLNGINTPATWIRSESEVKQLADADAEEQMRAQRLAEEQQQAMTAKAAGSVQQGP